MMVVFLQQNTLLPAEEVTDAVDPRMKTGPRMSGVHYRRAACEPVLRTEGRRARARGWVHAHG